ncbi:MAG: SUF system Fe-S cluster assembly protein [Proteobacteria bacterium]|nr:SUF system Fe-S cluster assembly protein [Pseudomonadota bacterium]
MSWTAANKEPTAAQHDPGTAGEGLFCEESRADAVGAAAAGPGGADGAATSAERQAGPEATGAADPLAGNSALEAQIIEALRQIYDPEIPVNVYDLGLIYSIDVLPLGRVAVRMTLTSPACPVAGALPAEVEEGVRGVAGVADAAVELVWEPPWTMEMMTEDARLELNLF